MRRRSRGSSIASELRDISTPSRCTVVVTYLTKTGCASEHEPDTENIENLRYGMCAWRIARDDLRS